jgi:hypothetical protein
MVVNKRQIYLLGEVSSEVWIDVGSQIPGIVSFPFQRIPGTSFQHGCAAPASVARLGEAFAFVAKDTRGQAIIGVMEGYTLKRISTHAVEQSLLDQTVSDAVAFTYQLEGHEMYVVTFPSINLTWVYDLATGAWHKWLYWNGQQYTRHRANCGAYFNGQYLVGDYENGLIYAVDNAVYTDNGQTIRRLRRCPHLTADLQRQYFDELQIQFQPGVGTTGLSVPSLNRSYVSPLVIGANEFFYVPFNAIYTIGTNNQNANQTTTNPQAMLRWSNDGGSTWSNEHWCQIGAMGKYKNRIIWRRLGWSRDRVFEVVVTDPIKAVIVSANLKASVGEN